MKSSPNCTWIYNCCVILHQAGCLPPRWIGHIMVTAFAIWRLECILALANASSFPIDAFIRIPVMFPIWQVRPRDFAK